MKNLSLLLAMMIIAVLFTNCRSTAPKSDQLLLEADSLLDCENPEDRAKGREMLRKLERDYPRYSDLLVFLGNYALDDEQYDVAVDYFTRAINCYGKASKFDHYYLYGIRAFAYRDMGNYEAAVCDLNKSYELALDDDPEAAIRAILYRADVRYLQEKYEESNADCKWVLEQDSLNCDALIGIARNCNAQGLYAEAIELTNRSEQIAPDYYATYKIRMASYRAQGETHKAIDDAIRFFELNGFSGIPDLDPIVLCDVPYAHNVVKQKINMSNNKEEWEIFDVMINVLNADYDRALKQLSVLEKEYGLTLAIVITRAECYSRMGDTEKEQAELAKAFEDYPLDSVE